MYCILLWYGTISSMKLDNQKFVQTIGNKIFNVDETNRDDSFANLLSDFPVLTK